MITIHHLNNSRSHRIIWLMEELGIPYDIKYYQRNEKTKLAPPELLKIHPLGLSPVITDGDITLAESGAIIEYILHTYGKDQLKPPAGSKEWTQYLYWLHYTEGTLAPVMLLRLIFFGIYTQSPFFIKPITGAIRKKFTNLFIAPRLTNQFNYIESTLEKNQWITGDEFTGADIQLSIYLIWAFQYKDLAENRPHTQAYINRIQARPAFIRTIEKGGPLETRF